ncbi:ClcB-like voltage-gated chloride channel protein [Thiocapsa roseopersicina]|uniref:FimV N-terminal domain-containing protein n=1 Tax=Thiocapsa roseopersicina TaxID=1058 RepID=A0A1H3A6R6_THIRO|nr:ClcB-like voltage-gated chloride channel protein [Thiocapsa roseopersicina]SDX24874.1 FimV N-terminal domain-containing protein [Thiocapsa roseopersicina]
MLWLAVAALPLLAGEDVGPIRSGDSLWKIADRIATEAGFSRDQVMVALLEANSEAFSPSCNVNGVLRVGAVLRVPSAERMGALDAATARRSIERQAREWAEHRRSGRALVCPTVLEQPAPESPAPVSVDGPSQADVAMPGDATRKPDRLPSHSPTESEVSPAVPDPTQAPEQASATATIRIDLETTGTHDPSASGYAALTRPTDGSVVPEPSLSPVSSIASGQTGDETCPCPSDPAGGEPPDQAGSAPSFVGESAWVASGEAPSHLPEGPLAPFWLLVPLVLGLLATSLVRRRPRAAAPLLDQSGTAAIAGAGSPGDAAALPPRGLPFLLALKDGDLVFLLLAALAGLLGALVTVVFREGIHGLEWLLVGHSGSLVVMALGLPPWQRLLLPAVGGLVAGLILEQIGGRLRGRTTTDYMEAVAVGDGWISVRQSLVKSASSLVTVASGGSIGREGAMVQLSAMVASTIGRVARFPRDRLRLLVAAGAAAGLAAAYNAPIAATLFVAEIVLGSIAIQHIGPLIVAAVIASVTVHDIMGYAPVYEIPAFSLVSDWELGLYVLLGIVAGHMAPIFLGLLGHSHRAFARLPMPLSARMALGGLIVGAISMYEPAVWGNGYSVVNTVLHEPWVWQALLTVMVLKMIATAATHGSGAVGGAFTPTLFVGALLGVLFGTAVHAVLPVGTGPPSAYAVVGMGAMLAATTHAPLMSIMMVFEMTMDYEIVLPLMLAVVTAHYTVRRYVDVAPMYAESLLPREADARRR